MGQARLLCRLSLVTLDQSHVLLLYKLFLASPVAYEREGKYSSSKINNNSSNASTTMQGKWGYDDSCTPLHTVLF